MAYDLSHFTPEDTARFWSKIRIHPKTGCWEWISTFNRAYPMFYTGTVKNGDRRSYNASRLAAQLKGAVLPRVAERSCGTIGCCNPLHTGAKGPAPSYPLVVVSTPKRSYTRRRRSQTAPGTERDAFLATLQPLKNGKSVSLAMDNPMFTSRAKYRGQKAKTLVILVPGSLAGISPDAVLVALVGSGSCIVRPADVSKVADLVLAGMPARLANVLMEKLHRLFKEK